MGSGLNLTKAKAQRQIPRGSRLAEGGSVGAVVSWTDCHARPSRPVQMSHSGGRV